MLIFPFSFSFSILPFTNIVVIVFMNKQPFAMKDPILELSNIKHKLSNNQATIPIRLFVLAYFSIKYFSCGQVDVSAIKNILLLNFSIEKLEVFISNFAIQLEILGVTLNFFPSISLAFAR